MTDQEIKAMLAENNETLLKGIDQMFKAQRKDIMHDVVVLMDAEFKPKFNLLAEEMQNINERLDRMEKKIDRIEDKVAEHEIKLKIVE